MTTEIVVPTIEQTAGNDLRSQLELRYPDYAREQLAQVANPDKRELYWQNVALLDSYLAAAVETEAPQTLDAVRALIDDQLARITPLEARFSGLTNHLAEISQFMQEFLTQDGVERFPRLLEAGQVDTLISLVAPTHDLLKFLSGPDGQIMPDHEQVTAYLLRKHFGQIEELRSQINFAAGVIEDHENIYREAGRRELIFSESSISRGKALFFIADVLTGVLRFDGQAVTIDQVALKERFADLYFRHIDLIAGKVFRPEWGLYAIGDIVTTLSELEDRYSLQLESGWQKTLVSAAQSAIDRSQHGNSDYSTEQRERISHAQQALQAIFLE